MEDYFAHLSDLVRFRVTSVSLQDEPFRTAILTEDMVTASLPLDEAQLPKQSTKEVESDIGIRISTENSPQDLFSSCQGMPPTDR